MMGNAIKGNARASRSSGGGPGAHARWRRVLTGVAVAALAVLLGGACSTKKNTAASRNWQAFTTRYNVYYNGITHFDEQLHLQEANYEDDYTRTVLTHPAEAFTDTKMPQPTGDFKRTIEKMQKAIQLHSIKKKPAKRGSSVKEKQFREREEFNPFLHNAWMTMGKAQYFSGDFSGAAATFFYIARHFKWLPDIVTEALLWQARSYVAMDWAYEAENVLHQVKPKMLTNKELENLYNLVQGGYYVRTEAYKEAVPYLQKAAKAAKGSQKNRLYFLLGQCYQQLGAKRDAYEAYGKAGSGISTAYRTKFNARIKQSEVFTGSNIKTEVRALQALTRYERNREYADQIYYAIGNLYLSRKDTAQAKANYKLAVEKSTRDGIDKAMAQLALGAIYFEEKDYVKAQPCYSEALPLINGGYPGYDILKRRSDVLDELAVYAGNVHLQDSLLELSKMTPEEQLAVCQKIVDELKKREKEEAEAAAREAYLAEQEGRNPDLMGQQQTTTGFITNGDNSWYFYNTMTKNAGKTEFQRRWGARKLEDDWRRRNKTVFAFEEEEETDEENPEALDDLEEATDSAAMARKELLALESDPHNPEYYLKDIPKTPEQVETCNEIIQEGLYNMGVILKDKLEDYPAARSEFDELMERYPENDYLLDVYYNMYLMAVREDNRGEAERWRQKIITEFPETAYGKAMTDPDYFEHLREMHALQESMYEEAYDAYLANRNKTVHSLTRQMEEDYPLSPILPKFVFIDALSYLTEGDYGQFKDRLTELLQRWPDTDMTPMAGSIVKNLNAGRVPHQGLSNSRGMIWDMRLSDSADTEPAADGQPANFERDPEKPQYMVLAFPRDSVNSNQLLYEVARFNFSSFVVKDFDLEPMSFGNVGLIVIKGFDNLRQLERYRSVMAQSDFELPAGCRPIMISKANFELLLREGRSFEDYFRFEQQDPDEDMPLPGVEGETPAEAEGQQEAIEAEEAALEQAEAAEGAPQPEEAPDEGVAAPQEEPIEETEEETGE
ncbi:MAG: tetratricopeptide repeat protein [Muribaculaceae bacterium]|nr:tetratricopeptide repeat protein [Muribaculaceae bacterium]